MRFLLALLTISTMRLLLLPVIVVSFIACMLVFCFFVIIGPILFGLMYLILGKNITAKILRTEDRYCNNSADIIMSSCMNLAEKAITAPAKAFGAVLERLQNLQTKLAKA